MSGDQAGYQVHPDATSINVEIIPGDPIDMLVPILDDNDGPVEILDADVALWSARSEIRRHWAATRVLHEWDTTDGDAEIVPGAEAKVRLTATAAVTADWQETWPELDAHWDLQVTPPGAESQTIAAGRFRLRPQYTR
jgi:hypothetical protein